MPPASDEGVRRLALAVAEVGPGPGLPDRGSLAGRG